MPYGSRLSSEVGTCLRKVCVAQDRGNLSVVALQVESKKFQALPGVQRTRYRMRVDRFFQRNRAKRHHQLREQGRAASQRGGPILKWPSNPRQSGSG
jgi:hypothetical protein